MIQLQEKKYIIFMNIFYGRSVSKKLYFDFDTRTSAKSSYLRRVVHMGMNVVLREQKHTLKRHNARKKKKVKTILT